MPELPDVENYRRYLDRHARRRVVKEVDIPDRRVLRKLPASRFRQRVLAARMMSTRRHGKHLLVALDKGGWITFHFGMTGAFAYGAERSEAPAYVRLRFVFSNGDYFAYTDPRKLGHIGFAEDADEFIAGQKLGPDALDPKFTLPAFQDLLASARGNAKSFLMDQSQIAGVGNIYADEILFQARIHPEAPVRQLSKDQTARLHGDLRRVLKIAIARGAGSENFIDRLPASYLLRHRDKDGHCPRCSTAIQTLRMSGRTSYFCPRCQRLGR
jgi:formamidopyrimidine-DNA glycosylase